MAIPYKGVGLIDDDGVRLFEVGRPGPGKSYSNVPTGRYVEIEIGFDPYPDVQDRYALEAITVCCVCGMPINPKTEAEHSASETLGVHLGECWHVLKRQAAMPRMRKLLES